MKGILKRLGLYETLDLELSMNLDQISDSIKKINDSKQITFFNLSPTSIVDYKGTYSEVSEDRLAVHFDIYPRHYIILIIALVNLTLILSIFALAISIMSFTNQGYMTAFGTLSIYLLLLLLFPIGLLKRMQWRVWDLRLDLEKELKKKEKEIERNLSA